MSLYHPEVAAFLKEQNDTIIELAEINLRLLKMIENQQDLLVVAGISSPLPNLALFWNHANNIKEVHVRRKGMS